MQAHLILANQLFQQHPSLESPKNQPIIMIESKPACQALPYHQLKITFLFSAMRHYAQWLRTQGREVIYLELQDDSLSQALTKLVKKHSITELSYMAPADKKPRQNLANLTKKLGIKSTTYPNKLHITSEEDFAEWYKDQKKPLMENFYRWQRRRLDILMDGDKPLNGQWNFDKDNRQPLPKNFTGAPPIPSPKTDDISKTVRQLVAKEFSSHAGADSQLWLPVTHAHSAEFLEDFISKKLELFGPYEDAIKPGEAFLYHSALSALLNIGLLTVDQVVQVALQKATKNFASLEGFIRQVIGWREYMYGLYWQLPELETANFFGFKKPLEQWWYELDYKNQELPEVIQATLKTTADYAYNHHIERLMVLGNWFLLNEYNPQEVNKWFMSMYVDAYEWVMLPNVVGMSQYADGGIVATKPYISGDAYLKRMGGFKPSDQPNLSYTEKYWQFLYNQREKLAKNPRLSLAVSQATKRHQK